ncbi:hypothetical protein J4427_03640 [Candidatus Woesearchaeota archaeon]|nr:hypothetical protein [Candidatus Woesearchaeota archaeon]
MADLFLIPVITIGIVLGLYELILIHRDENFRGSHWLGHGLHAITTMIIALFATMNTEYFLEVTGLLNSGIPFISNVLLVRIAIGLILNIKIHATSAIIKGRLFAGGLGGSMAEHWTHTTIVSALVVLAPYLWPFLAPFVPVYLGGTA